MSWILFAVLGHILNAVAFIIDKVLLTSAFKKSATYAGLIGGISLIALIGLPWVRRIDTVSAIPAIVAFGCLFVLALWSFFEALKHGEASRVVPIIGSTIPLFTLAGTSLFLQERLTLTEWAGLGLLLIATAVLSSGSRTERLSPSSLRFGLLSALLFAISSVCGKYAFEQTSFLNVFILSRIAAGVTGLLIAVMVPGTLHELLTMGRTSSSRKQREAFPFSPKTTSLLALAGQGCGALGFVAVTIALSRGSAALVNALQATQYTLIVLVAWFGGSRLRQLMHEDRSPHIILIKSVAIFCVAIGLALLSHG